MLVTVLDFGLSLKIQKFVTILVRKWSFASHDT